MKQSSLRTIIYGRSIMMAGLEASLENHDDFVVLRRIESMFDIEQVDSTNVDLFLFDSSLPEAKKIKGLLGNESGMLVMGLDLENYHLNFFSLKNNQVENIFDLANLIYKLVNS